MGKSRSSITLRGPAASSFLSHAMADNSGLAEKSGVHIKGTHILGMIESRTPSVDGKKMHFSVVLLRVPPDSALAVGSHVTYYTEDLEPAGNNEMRALIDAYLKAQPVTPVPLNRAAAWGYVRNAKAILSGERLATEADRDEVIKALADLVATHLLGQHP